MSPSMILLPEILLLVGALIVLFAEYLPGKDRSGAVIGTLLALASSVAVWLLPNQATLFGTMLTFDGTPSATIRSAVAGLTAVFLLWVAGNGWAGSRSRDAVSMALFASCGGMLLASVSDIVMLFMALELATMPAYVMMGYRRDDRRGLEGTLKYFLMSVLTSLLMAYGLSFVYGISGSTAYAAINLTKGGSLGLVAGMLVVLGFFAKMSAAPLHFWAPDAYEGASAPAVAYVSSIAKVAAMFAMIRFVAILMPTLHTLPFVLVLVSIFSMALGNLAALPQTDIRRIIAYSGVAHVGYLLLGLATGTPVGYAATAFYVLVYAVPSLGIMLVVGEAGPKLADVAGLVSRKPMAAWSSLVFLLSLIGIPPMAGFFGKLYLFGAALSAGAVVAVVIALLLSVVSAGYYFKVVRAMFTPGEGAPEAPAESASDEEAAYPRIAWLGNTAIALCTAATVGIGLASQPLLGLLGVAFGRVG